LLAHFSPLIIIIMTIPIIYFLALLISKEIFSYDGEKVVILCILSFLFIAYYQTKTAVSDMLIAKSKKLEEEYIQLIDLKLSLEKNINEFWKAFLELENHLVEIVAWLRFTVQNVITKLNKNRQLFVFHVVKDHINILFKDYLNIKYFFQKSYIKSILNNVHLVFQLNLPYSNLTNLNYSFVKLKNTTGYSDFNILVLNKLNLNHEISLSSVKNHVSFISKDEKDSIWVDSKTGLLSF